MRDVAIGQYYPANSVLHRLDPRIKLIAAIAYIVSVFFIRSFIMYGVLALFLIVVVACSKVPPIKVLKSLRVVLFLVIFTTLMTVLFYNGSDGDTLLLGPWWVITVYKEGLFAAGKLALRILFLIVGPTMLTFTTTPVELTDALERLLKPLNLIRIPVHSIAMIMSIALRLIPTLIEETDKIKNAQKARGASFDTGNIFKRALAMIPILIPLFVSSFRRANDLADAMDSRCYRGAVGRTRMKVMHIRARDIVAMCLMALLLFVLLWTYFNFFPALIDLNALPWFL